VLEKDDPVTGQPLIGVIVDEAAQKGTGRWTAQDALELGVPAPTMTTAVYAIPIGSTDRTPPRAGVLTRPAKRFPEERRLVTDVRDALYASKIVASASGCRQPRARLGACPPSPRSGEAGASFAPASSPASGRPCKPTRTPTACSCCPTSGMP
jgi:6-phosphogluconate dehydrogenase